MSPFFLLPLAPWTDGARGGIPPDQWVWEGSNLPRQGLLVAFVPGLTAAFLRTQDARVYQRYGTDRLPLSSVALHAVAQTSPPRWPP